MEPDFFDRFFRQNRVPPEVDVEVLRKEWLALQPPYHIANRHLPLPIWARRPFTDDGHLAWQVLGQMVPVLDPANPFCIYLHIPFCAERCRFCDCYSFKLASHRQQHVENYIRLLDQEMDLWSRLGTLARRPVSTVHFGGGTPSYLGLEPFERLVRSVQKHFVTGPETEWALESTTSELTPEMLSLLDALGFRRLHIGVQTLQDGIRRNLNRRASASLVLHTIADAVARGWIVSVDLIYGLPDQSLDSLLDDIRALVAAGVDGFSMYELQISSRNRRFTQQHGLDRRDRRLDYLLIQVASRTLMTLGYRKTLFNHFAGSEDTNLYFTFPERGEDLLALGTVADGVFGDYHYRHPEYAAYCRSVTGSLPGLQGGLRRNERENRLQPLVTALMAGCVPLSLLSEPEARALLPAWQASLLLDAGDQEDNLRLTGNGSWFVGNMLSQLVAQTPPIEGQAGDGA